MGFFDAIFPSMKDMEKAFQEQMKRETQYLQMEVSNLKMLDDDDLYEAVRVRIDNKVFATEDMAEGLGKLSADEIIFYAVNTLDMEVNNGGLCQFFVNSSRVLAPVIGNCLAVIGAKEHQQLYEGFIARHHIDVADLSFFDVLDVADFAKHAERYPFEEYDNAFYELPPVTEYLIPYIGNHTENL